MQLSFAMASIAGPASRLYLLNALEWIGEMSTQVNTLFNVVQPIPACKAPKNITHYRSHLLYIYFMIKIYEKSISQMPQSAEYRPVTVLVRPGRYTSDCTIRDMTTYELTN